MEKTALILFTIIMNSEVSGNAHTLICVRHLNPIRLWDIFKEGEFYGSSRCHTVRPSSSVLLVRNRTDSP